MLQQYDNYLSLGDFLEGIQSNDYLCPLQRRMFIIFLLLSAVKYSVNKTISTLTDKYLKWHLDKRCYS